MLDGSLSEPVAPENLKCEYPPRPLPPLSPPPLLLLLLLLPMCLRSVSFAERRVRVCLRVRCLSGDAGAR